MLPTVLLARAACGCYPAGSLKDAPRHWLARAFELRDGQYCVLDHLRDGVRFDCQDIRRQAPPGPFDLVLCRNLAFTYFEPELQAEVLGRIATVMTEGGHLVIGGHERLADGHGFEPVSGAPCLYRIVAAEPRP